MATQWPLSRQWSTGEASEFDLWPKRKHSCPRQWENSGDEDGKLTQIWFWFWLQNCLQVFSGTGEWIKGVPVLFHHSIKIMILKTNLQKSSFQNYLQQMRDSLNGLTMADTSLLLYDTYSVVRLFNVFQFICLHSFSFESAPLSPLSLFFSLQLYLYKTGVRGGWNKKTRITTL